VETSTEMIVEDAIEMIVGSVSEMFVENAIQAIVND
jgi:hypothetical protein